MYKKLLLTLTILVGSFFLLGTDNVFAYGNEIVYSFSEAADCEGILGSPSDSTSVAYFLQQILSVMQYAGPILCIALSLTDFVKATASQDKDALSKATKTTGKRIVYALILFFIPTLVDYIFPLLGWYGTCGIG